VWRGARILLLAAAATAAVGTAAPGIGAERLPPPPAPQPASAQPPTTAPPEGIATGDVPHGLAPEAQVDSSTPTLCGRFEWKWVHWYRHWSVIRNDNFADNECINNVGDGPNYRVSRSTANSVTSQNQAFPHIFEGCSWSICTPGTGLPYPWIRLQHVYATVFSSQRALGKWNSAFDLWFGQQRHTTGQAKGTELMIWVGSREMGSGRGPIIWIGGARWYLHHWHACNALGCWNYIMFWRVRSNTLVRHLDLLPFFRYANTPGTAPTAQNKHGVALAKNWYLWNVEFGNEIWRGGNGLGASFFRLQGLPTVPFTPPS
jgi:Glycosyl hydrolase family 12